MDQLILPDPAAGLLRALRHCAGAADARRADAPGLPRPAAGSTTRETLPVRRWPSSWTAGSYWCSAASSRTLAGGCCQRGSSSTASLPRTRRPARPRRRRGCEVALDGLLGLYFGASDPRNVAHLAVYRAHAVGGRLRSGRRRRRRPCLPARRHPPGDRLRVAARGHRRLDRQSAERAGLTRGRRLLRYAAAGPRAGAGVRGHRESAGQHRSHPLRRRHGDISAGAAAVPWPLPVHYGWIRARSARPTARS